MASALTLNAELLLTPMIMPPEKELLPVRIAVPLCRFTPRLPPISVMLPLIVNCDAPASIEMPALNSNGRFSVTLVETCEMPLVSVSLLPLSTNGPTPPWNESPATERPVRSL